MAVRSESVLDPSLTTHPHSGKERCPLCDQVLPQGLRIEELQSRMKDRVRAAEANVEKRLRAQFEADQAAKIEALKQKAAAEATEREKLVRAEAQSLAEKALRTEIAKSKEEKAKAIKERESAIQAANKLKAEQEDNTKRAIKDALQQQREALEKDKTNALHKIQAQEFEKTQKLQKQVELLKRQLDQRTADEIGEGAEVDLYEALRENFEGDRITRIKKGQPGADILHEVIHGGQNCGSIIYDSKNHAVWRTNFVQKLKADQLAAKADHAVLTTSSFPSGARQLCVQDDVIVCNPARVVEIVRLVRDRIILSHRLRLSRHERGAKTEALYKFINSERCQQLMNRYESIADDLLNLEVDEVKAHEAMWRKRGKLIRDAQKTHGDFRSEVDRIVEGSDE